ncbi:MAG: hypothetical protein EBR34_12720, partial [Sphingomonadaceae bacterium]|nr:hypothetical protein [Sphingomonadaceae bacterium]
MNADWVAAVAAGISALVAILALVQSWAASRRSKAAERTANQAVMLFTNIYGGGGGGGGGSHGGGGGGGGGGMGQPGGPGGDGNFTFT